MLLKLNNHEGLFKRYKAAMNTKLKSQKLIEENEKEEIRSKVKQFGSELDCITLVYDVKVLKEKVEFLLSKDPSYVSLLSEIRKPKLDSPLIKQSVGSPDPESRIESKYLVNEANESNIFTNSFQKSKFKTGIFNGPSRNWEFGESFGTITREKYKPK